MTEAAFLAAGAATGLLVGLTGVGGGALMTPILLFLGVPAAVAVATDLWFAALTKLAAIAAHRRHTPIDWLVVRRLWLGSLPVALAVAGLVSTGARIGKIGWLSQAVGAMVCIAALGMLLGPALSRFLGQRMRSAQPVRGQAALTVAAGAGVGAAAALTSVGAGTLGTALLLALYPQRLTPHRLVVADLVHATGLALVGGLVYAVAGKLVDWRLLAWLLAGSLPAAAIAGLFAGRLPAAAMRWALGGLLLLIGGAVLVG